MIKRLQKLRSARGFTMIELIVVIAILAILIATVFVSANTTQKRIEEANSTATDFYSAIQTEFTNLQMFDGPITMTLSKVYSTKPDSSDALKISALSSSKYGGIKYYPFAGGNYLFDHTAVGDRYTNAATALENHLKDTPKTADLYLCFYVRNDQLTNITWANTASALLALDADASGDATSELEAVLEHEMGDRMSYKSGYYYAYIHYDAPAASPTAMPSDGEYKVRPVKVMWTAYSANELELTSKFKSQGLLENGRICGVCKTDGYETLNVTGTSLFTFAPSAPTP